MRKGFICTIVIVGIVLIVAGSALCLIDINSASQSELESLSGVGPATAKKIIDGRPYSSINDITRVKGIGNKTFAKFKDKITVGAPEKKKKSKAVAPSSAPIEVPVYSTESFQTIKCWNCKNVSQVSRELKSGWCPYCNAKWAVK
ncbi:MAG: ComEA family DNA-binding protein [Candidatus Tritonobacter lacicola]|nr:ComEA family DNA-binding protein [Candidatus Tritonobacter lacicola]